MDKKSVEYNEKITSNKIKVIDEEGRLVGEMSKEEGIHLANEKGLDLVICSPTAIPPVAKICALDKYLFTMKKKAQLIKKNTSQTSLKKLKIGAKIDQHDLDCKLKKAQEILKDGDMVTFFMKFRKKELPQAEEGMKKLTEAAEKLQDIASILKEVMLEKNTASLTIKPVKKK